MEHNQNRVAAINHRCAISINFITILDFFVSHWKNWSLSRGYKELNQRRRRRQRQLKCSKRLILAKQLCTCITLFCTFLSRHCTTTTWKCLISRFVEDMNTRQRLYFPFPELRYSLLEFNSRKNCPHLAGLKVYFWLWEHLCYQV